MTFEHIVMQAVLKNTRLLHLFFLANHGSFQRACVPIGCFANTDGVHVSSANESLIQLRTTQEEKLIFQL